MAEVPTYESPETPASSSIARVGLCAQLIGEETAAQVRADLAELDVRSGSMAFWPGRAGRRAEREVLRAHSLLGDQGVEEDTCAI